MGCELKKVFDLVTTKAGFKGRVQLSTRCGIPSDHALATEEDETLLNKVKQIASEILGEDVNPLL
ncbi:MAG TPA: hypothetical protein PKK12_07090 [Candidatus Aminicenantes bacterium]|nr:hypothetical protein [Candidatus Aminicenantes bacterium]